MSLINLNKIAFNKDDLKYVYVETIESKHYLVIVFKNDTKHHLEYKDEIGAKKALCIIVSQMNGYNTQDLFE